ncbi:MAG: EF-hand domain-containing protein [Alphaproteobacteria bacterium]|nr:EF-hand domain-containing protein [Alphaproteobacteria bacterium]MCB9930475.1 EF-hand domain-containing protein [Alphaproteobacteria bacterium]
MSKVWLALATAGFLMASPAMAANADFAKADANGDGSVSMEEAKAVMPDLTEAQFKAADADGSGSLDEKEFASLS